jgi:hypothetical protein
MASDILFVPLHENRDQAAHVPMVALREAFRHFGVLLSDFSEGSHQFDITTPEGGAWTFHEQAGLTIRDGDVTAFWIHRPTKSGQALWLALLDLGFVMIPTDGPVFANRVTAHRVRYLNELSARGVQIVERVADFRW